MRELENAVQRAVVLTKGGIVTSTHILATNLTERAIVDIAQLVREGVSLNDILKRVERLAIAQAMEIADDNQEAAYEALGIKKPMFK